MQTVPKKEKGSACSHHFALFSLVPKVDVRKVHTHLMYGCLCYNVITGQHEIVNINF